MERGKEERKYFKICDLIFPRLCCLCIFSIFFSVEIFLEYSNNIVVEGEQKGRWEKGRDIYLGLM